MKILVLISNFIDHASTSRSFTLDWQFSVLDIQLRQFMSYETYQLDIKRFTTPRGIDYNISGVENIVYPHELGLNFAYSIKEWTVKNRYLLSDYDYVLFTEDDLLIREQQFHNVIQNQLLFNNVNLLYKAGFIRFEHKSDGSRVYIDQHHAHSVHRGGNSIVKQSIQIENETFFEPWNIHSGCWLFSSKEIVHMMDTGTYQSSPYNLGRVYCGPLESAATEIYFDYIKLYPIDIDTVAVEHMCDKYLGVTKEQILQEILSEQGRSR